MKDKIDILLEKKIGSPIKVPIEITYGIQNCSLQTEHFKRRRMRTMKKKILAICCTVLAISTIVVGGLALSGKIGVYNEGVDIALKNDYAEKVNMGYVESNGVKMKVDYVLMDDLRLDLMFHVKFNQKQPELIYTYFKKVIIKDENDNYIWYISDKGELTEQEAYEGVIAGSSGCDYAQAISEKESIQTVYFLANNPHTITTTFPKSKKLHISISEIEVIGEGTDNKTITGDWNFTISLPEKFYQRDTVTYQLQNPTDTISLKEAILSNTGLRIQVYINEVPVEQEKFMTFYENLYKSIVVEDLKGNVHHYNTRDIISMESIADGKMQLNATFAITNYDKPEQLKVRFLTPQGTQAELLLMKQ